MDDTQSFDNETYEHGCTVVTHTFRTQVQAELQELDPSARVNMTTGHVHFDTSVSYQGHERGHALLQRLVQSQHRVEIRETMGQNQTASTDREAATDPNTGSGSIISLNRTSRVRIPVYIQGHSEYRDSPLHITLGHELIHADQMRRGRDILSQYMLFEGIPILELLPVRGRVPQATMQYQSLSGQYLNARIVEVRAVGLTDLPGYIVTENQLRQESGLPPRDRYDQYSWQ